MSYPEELLRLVSEKCPKAAPQVFADDVRLRVERLAAISPLYQKLLLRHPEYLPWLENPDNRDVVFGAQSIKNIWSKEFEYPFASTQDHLLALQKFRRKMSLRIAYREINNLSTLTDSFAETTHVADYCLQQVYALATEMWEKRLGTPWDEENDCPSRFCILAMGKMGACELNFCSDIDLIYFYEGRGNCRKNNKPTLIANEEFFTRVGKEVASMIQERSNHGFLYNVDLRLRPEGASGPVVRSLASMEHYYSAAGQSWERLAMIKARPVAGDLQLGEEFFESVNSFRYPRYPPPSILMEVSGVKIRIEKEVLGAGNLESNIKTGFGGIREIEFFVQALQLLNAGRNPFLQTPRTLEALEKLQRYEILNSEEATFLIAAYRFLRLVENRLQMREEGQTHSLPEVGPQRAQLAVSLGFDSEEAFDKEMKKIRDGVRKQYESLFSADNSEHEIQEWTMLLSGSPISQSIEEKITRWFGNFDPSITEILRNVARGGPHNLLTREQVILFREITMHFDSVFPSLACPRRTLERLAVFAEKYGARTPLLKACSSNRSFFEALCLLFDRSRFIHNLLCKHPEIIEEVLIVHVNRIKSGDDLLKEIAHLNQGDEFPQWLWLYVKAEQVRLAIAQMLSNLSAEDLEKNLSLLADAALRFALDKVDPEKQLTVIALGKYGGQEMTFGSDLDLLILGDDNHQSLTGKIHQFIKVVSHRHPMGLTFEVDLRLRPHGQDGPLITSLTALKQYHARSAQTWEKQILTRARFVAGNEKQAEAFFQQRDELLYTDRIDAEQVGEIWDMRKKIETAKVDINQPEGAFKAGPGGLLDIEFLCQIFQLALGSERPSLRSPNTRTVLMELGALNLVEPADMNCLLENYNFLRKIELYLRRDNNESVSQMATGNDQQETLAKWLNFADSSEFLSRYHNQMQKNRQIVSKILQNRFKVD